MAQTKTRAHTAKPSRPIELYFWPTSNGLKINMMLEECGLPYALYPVDINKDEQFHPHFLKISPNNRIPAILDPDGPDGKPISIFESGAILQYLGRKTGMFYATRERDIVEIDQWLFWQIGGLGPMAGQAHHFRDRDEKIPYAVERYTKEVTRLYGVMERRLGDRDYLAGDYSIADIACWGWSRSWKRQGQTMEHFPRVMDWHRRIGERPAVQHAVTTGEFVRDPKHHALAHHTAPRIVFGWQKHA